MSSNNHFQGLGNSPIRNISSKFGSSVHNSNNSNSNTGSDFISRLASNSPSKSVLHAFSNSSNSQQSSPIHLAEANRRPSANLSRISFLYNNSFTNGTPNITTGGSSNNSSNNSNHNVQNNNKNNVLNERVKFQTSSEILACDRAWETPNLVSIATPRNLQLLKVSTTEITLETELSMKPTGRIKIGTISDLAFGHQQYGRYLAASTITGSIHLYNLDRGTRMKTTLTGHQRAVNSINFNHLSPHLLASGSQDGKILIWDLKASNSKPSMILNCNAEAVRCVTFSPKKNNIIAAVFDSGVVEKWDLRKNNTWERKMNAHTGPALSVHWHPELDYIVTGGRDKQLQVWNLGPGNESREPCHVINTSGPISKAKWCKGRGNNSILNTDIAISFYNDDSCVQIWNLNRKYIPKSIIDGHNAPITQIIWRTPKNLISCSKDKTLIQYDVTKEQNFIDNFPSNTFTWNPCDKYDLLFIKQKKSQFEGPFTSSGNININNSLSQRHNPSSELNTVEEVDLSNNNNISQTSTIGSNNSNGINIQNGSESGMHLYESLTTSPAGHSPTLTSSLKLQRQQLPPRQPSFVKPIQKNSLPIPAWVVPVHLPLLSNNLEKFKFLSTHYMLKIPEGSNIIEVCEYNSMLAASVGYFRDCQTWRTIKMSIILKIEDDNNNNIENEEEIDSKLKHFQFQKNDSFSQSDSRLGTSYGSESELDRKNNELSGSYPSDYSIKYHNDNNNTNNNTLNQNNNYGKNIEIDENAIIDDEEDNNDSSINENYEEGKLKNDNTRVKISKETESSDEQQNTDKDLSQFKPKSKSQRSSSTSLSNAQLRPIIIDPRAARNRGGSLNNTYRYSFTGSSVDMDDEKSASPLSLSCSPLIHKSRSRMLLMMMNKNEVNKNDNNEDTESLQIGKSVETRFSKMSDNRSQLTAILKDKKERIRNENDEKNQNIDSNLDKDLNSRTNSRIHYSNHNQLKEPWNPYDLVKQAAGYSSDQGDILMCATLSLLFLTTYASEISRDKIEEWIFNYHEYLLRCGFFNNAATVLRIASETFDSFKKIGQTKTSVRTLCYHCGKPITNDESKESYNKTLVDNDKDDINKNNFGFWYCDKCKKLQGGCSYCGEPIKGNTVALIGCGHEGHFGCFRTWFIEQQESECPACGYLCIN